METSGWIQFALYRDRARRDHEADGALSDARSRRRMARRGSIRCCAPLERLTYRVDGCGSSQRARLEAIHARHAALQSGGLPVHLRDSAAAAFAAVESARTRAVSAASCVQHRSQFHHQHQLAELRRRIDDVVFLADGRAGVSQFRFGRHRYRHRGGAGSRQSRGTRPKRSAISGSTWCG